MDISCTLPDMKIQKIGGGQKVVESEDRISQLSDSLLHHILSFLPTKNAVATCILSTRWQDLWISVTNLDFECSNYYKKEFKFSNGFMNFVEKVLLLHSSNIKMFRLKHCGVVDSFRLSSWIYAAVRRHVHELHLSFRMETVLMLPRCLCTSKTLTVLKIEHARCHLQFASTTCFSSLRTLHLCDVTLVDDLSIHRLFSGLLVLEELKLCRCGWWNVKRAIISIPTLRNLTIDVFCPGLKDECQIKVNTENLKYVSCTSDLTIDLVLDNLSSSVETHINFESSWSHPKVRSYAENLFRVICFAKTLKICDATLEGIHCSFMENLDLLPTFVNLTSLEVKARVMSDTSRVLMGILSNSPVLEDVFIKEVCAGKLVRNPLPQGLNSCLKSCCLQCFDGRPAEMSFVTILLENATTLERMKIHCSQYLTGEVKMLKDVTKQLEMVTRASESCVIELLKHGGPKTEKIMLQVESHV
ncbi:F-box/LRR-repeat protein At4g14103-like [Tripterygium wilfordii]|uniref:F-box/LRR-repeat protein At4g14103-like n=1 Tax=Tripterygium wilfordii TaxID=458696 RepID=UPI0018F82879|nr:F-box/LRR-repeat protein At4g14103-like [Tripterygium wilfordii]XP_038702919.1 F-box/LRR-repeat protein At4g14103-like [Tripterygium wilfordii]XP_038702920.1 F-box/LRR-repeat protein At4g14103-like [Tripterygium wilfordii]